MSSTDDYLALDGVSVRCGADLDDSASPVRDRCFFVLASAVIVQDAIEERVHTNTRTRVGCSRIQVLTFPYPFALL
jgi:hypothetical protein